MAIMLNSYTRMVFALNVRALIRRRLSLVGVDIDEFMLRNTERDFSSYINNLDYDKELTILAIRSGGGAPIYIPLNGLMVERESVYHKHVYLLPPKSPEYRVLVNCYNAVYAPHMQIVNDFIKGVRMFIENRRSWGQVVRDWPELMLCAPEAIRRATIKPSKGPKDLTERERDLIEEYDDILAECALLPDVDDKLAYFD